MLIQLRPNSNHPDVKLLKADRTYSVYAILLNSPAKYLVSEGDSFSFPFFVSDEAVDVVDERLPASMFFSSALPKTEEYSSRAPIIGFEAIVLDRFFYQRLVEVDREAVTAWGRAKEKVDSGLMDS